MELIDTHTHLYLDDFSSDRDQVIQAAIDQGVECLLLPNIDRLSIAPLLDLCKTYPAHCFPMMGLHPTSVDHNFAGELQHMKQLLEQESYIAIGEIGIDLYWDKTFAREQESAFRAQLQLAREHHLPVVIHSRNAFDEIMDILKDEDMADLKGVFHCFSGTAEQAQQIIDQGLLLGIGGVLTFKNSHLDQAISEIDVKHLLLETDAPYLTPVPFRGKRNQSAYLKFIAEKLATIKGIEVQEVARITSQNARELFQLNRTSNK